MILVGSCAAMLCVNAFSLKFSSVSLMLLAGAVSLTVFLIRDDERIALRKRPARGLLAGLYEYPNAEGHLDAVEAEKCVRQLGFAPIRIRSLPPAKHIFTHKEWHMIGYEVRADELTPPPSGGGILLAQVSEIRDVYSVPSAFAAFTERVLVGE